MIQNAMTVRCCIAGGGPAGMMLGLLLARAGVDVLVLEKHADFLRDFRGDTIHPSTLEIMYELGLLDAFLRLPHEEVRTFGAQIGETSIDAVDFAHVGTHCKFTALMPQWDFLDFVAAEARRYPNFKLLMETEATDLIEQDGRIAGLRAGPTRDCWRFVPTLWSARMGGIRPYARERDWRRWTLAHRWMCSGCGCRGKSPIHHSLLCGSMPGE